MAKKYLKMHERWLAKGRLPFDGLCSCLYDYRNGVGDELLALFTPIWGEVEYNRIYWAHGGVATSAFTTVADDIYYSYTPLRQTIMLLLAAMNDEL